MPRAQKGAARRQAKVRKFKAAKGMQGARAKQWRRINESLTRAGAFSYRDRRTRKREFRKLWIIRINAACRLNNISYSNFIAKLSHADIQLNRKMLSEIAIHDPETFTAIVEQAKAAPAPEKQAA